MTNEIEILKKLERIERHLNAKAPQHWVKVGFIQDVTGWDKEGLRRARENGLIKQRRGTNGIEYLLESIPEMFIRKNQTA